MRRFLIIFIFMWVSQSSAIEVPFKRGFNFAEWLQKPSATQVQFSRFTKQDFIHIKKMGCDHIRLPLHLFNMSGEAPSYAIDPLLFTFLDQIIDWAEELELHLILDNHSFAVEINTTPEILDQLIAVWKQLAARYKDRSTFIYYEILNEPHGIDDDTWNDMQQQVINAIRSVDDKHTIIVGPAGWNSYDHLKYMPHYSDDNLIYTFHFYDPFLFTHQGATWVDPPMGIAGVPYPYDAVRMPALPASLKGTWIEFLYTTYPVTGNDGWVKNKIDIAVNFMKERGVPLWCGEFGAYIPNSSTEDRARWLQTVRTYFEENGIAWTMWEYASGFGIFEPGSAGVFDYDVNLPIIEALGLTLPEQKEFILRPDSTGFVIYDDYLGSRMFENSWLLEGMLNYYDEHDPVSRKYCIQWTGINQYGFFGCYFAPIKDLSQLVAQGFAVDFWVRCAAANAKIDIRFVDTKTSDPFDHPWRMRYTIDATVATWNGEWQHVQIPLNEFTEHGSWDNNQWYDPQGKFDWTRVDQFQVVAEYHDLQGIDFHFDEIRVVDPRIVAVDEQPPLPARFELLQNFPNPFNAVTNIRFRLKNNSGVKLTIFNIEGQKVYQVQRDKLPAGMHLIQWKGIDFKGNPLPGGIYIYQLETDTDKQCKRMVLLW